MRCASCGSELDDGSSFCTNCGTSVKDAQGASEQASSDAVTQQTASPQPAMTSQKATAQSQASAPQQTLAQQVASAAQPSDAKPGKNYAVPIAISAIAVVAIIVVLVVVFLVPAKDEPTLATNPAASTQSASEAPTFENSFLRITLPKDIADQVSFSESDGWITMTYVPTKGTLLSIYPKSNAPDHELEDKAETYSLGEASVNGQTQQVMMRIDYFGSSNTPAHWSAQDATQLGIAKVFAMSVADFASCVELNTGSGYAMAHATPITEGANSSAGTQSAASGVPSSAFWGIWAQASKDKSEAEAAAQRIRNDYGLDAFVVLTTDWSNLNSEPWYCVSIGSYPSQDAANAALSQARTAFSDAYIKYSGDRK